LLTIASTAQFPTQAPNWPEATIDISPGSSDNGQTSKTNTKHGAGASGLEQARRKHAPFNSNRALEGDAF
jgi:hypothetical protein